MKSTFQKWHFTVSLLILTGLSLSLKQSVSQTLPDSGTILYGRFGVVLELQEPHGGGTYPSFSWESFIPTQHIETVDWVESDWYGNWSFENWNYSTIRHESFDGSNEDWYPSGGEWYDVEALYFDNDVDNFYVVVITSVPQFRYFPEIDSANVGIYDPRFPAWFIPGDLSINLFKGTPHKERYNTVWYYDYGVNTVHENRDSMLTQGAARTPAMRDFELGNKLFKTRNDSGGGDNNNYPDNPFRLPENSDWYVGAPKSATTGHWEHTNFDPLSRVSKNLGIQYIGDVVSRVYEIVWTNSEGDTLYENNAPTYAWEFIIPRHLFGDDNPNSGDKVGIQWVEGCRNDGNNTSGVVNIGDIDEDSLDFGDAPERYPTTIAFNGAVHRIVDTLFLGNRVDAEFDGQPSNLADGDDQAGSPDDEDGVSFTGTFQPFKVVDIDITASRTGYLDAWIDYNGDGDWLDNKEQIFTKKLLTAGINELFINVPDLSFNGFTYARFRYSLKGGLNPSGFAGNGEVEDYRIEILPKPTLDLGVVKSVYNAAPKEGEASTFSIIATNYSQNVTASRVVYEDILSSAFRYISSNSSIGTYNPSSGHWAIPSLSPQEQAILEIVVQADTSADNYVRLLSLDQTDTNPNNNDDLVSVSVSGSSGGNSGGLESNGSLAGLIAQRNHQRMKTGVMNKFNHPEEMTVFSENLAVMGIQLPEGKHKSGSNLVKLIPEEGPYATRAYISTPSDLIGISNASEVIAVDYFDDENRRMAAILAMTTQDEVYNHTKLICDRLTGAQLEIVRPVTIHDHSFILGKLVQPNGDVDYSVSFIVYPGENGMVIDNRWHNEEYVIPEATDIYNFQVWSVTQQSTLLLIGEILDRIETEGQLYFNNPEQAKMPKVFVTKGRYHNGELELTVLNNAGASQIIIDGTLTRTEQSIREHIQFNLGINPQADEYTLTIPTGFIFDIGFNLANDVDGMRDGLYFADGPWGIDFEDDGALIDNYSVGIHNGSDFENSLLLERNVDLSGSMKSYVSIFRQLKPGNIPVDLSEYNQISFDAMGSGILQVTLSKPWIESWADQFRTSITIYPSWQNYSIGFDRFISPRINTIFTGDQILSATFSISSDGNTWRDFDLHIRNLRFTKESSSVNPLQPSATSLSVFPNPFSNKTTIHFETGESSHISIRIYDLNGREMITLADEPFSQGEHMLEVELPDLDPGIYVVKMTSEKSSQTTRITLLK